MKRTVAVAAVVLALGALARQPDVAVVAGAPAAVRLDLPPGYVLLSPAMRLLDAIALLSLGQHVALWITVLACWALWWRRRARGVRHALVVLAALTAATFVVYAAVALLPRPSARLAVDDPALVRVDFHVHTRASGDAGRWRTVARVREWERQVGVDAAYVADHRAFAGVREARAGNPARSGEGVVLLAALEGYLHDLHVVFLGLAPEDSALVVRQHVRAERLGSGRPVVAIATLPGTVLETVDAGARDRPPHVRAIEIVDGAPKGLWQGDRDGPAVRARADSLGLALVTGSNNHGWGRTMLGWTLVRIPGWRSVPPDTLALRIEDAVRAGRAGDLRAVARRRPIGRSWLAVAAVVPVLGWQTLTALQPSERIAWLFWVAVGAWIYRRSR